MRPPPTIKKRSDFLQMNRAERWVTPGFILQMAPADTTEIGYTVSKKVGNAVIRNRVKRRLRALAADLLSGDVVSGQCVRAVLIGRPGAQDIAFDQSRSDLKWALKRLSPKIGLATSPTGDSDNPAQTRADS